MAVRACYLFSRLCKPLRQNLRPFLPDVLGTLETHLSCIAKDPLTDAPSAAAKAGSSGRAPSGSHAPSVPPSFLPSLHHFFLPRFCPPSLLPSFLPSLLPSFLRYYSLSSFLPCFLSASINPFIPHSSLPSFLPHLFPRLQVGSTPPQSLCLHSSCRPECPPLKSQ